MKQATIRKFVSLVLALTLVMGMSVTVFADDYEDNYYYDTEVYLVDEDYDEEVYLVDEVDTTPVAPIAPVLTGLFPPANIQPGEFCYVSGNWYHGIPTPWAMQ